MIELKENVNIIHVKKPFYMYREDTYFWVFVADDGYIQLECGGKAWLVQSIDEFLEEIDYMDCEVTQYQLVKL